MEYTDIKVLAKHGANFYNASTEHERTRWEINSKQRFQTLINAEKLAVFIYEHQNVFTAEMRSVGITVGELAKLMQLAYAAETNFGTTSLVSHTGVVGGLQVTTGTFRDLADQGILGNKAAKVLGYRDRGILQTLSNKEVRKLLMSDTGSFLSGTGKMLQTLM